MTKSENGTHNYMLKSIIEPPTWEKNTGLPANTNLESYIRNLKLFKDLNVFQNDTEIIYASLYKSGRLNIFNELLPAETSDLDKYITYLKSTYGGNTDNLRDELRNISQANDESYVSFFRRTIHVYYQSRENSYVPNLAEITDTHTQNDIRYHFLKGLQNNKVRDLIKTNESEIIFDKLGKQAQTYAQALSTTQQHIITADVNHTN